MTHIYKSLLIFGLLCGILGNANIANGKRIHDKNYKYKITIPKTALQIKDTSGGQEGSLFYDTSKDIVLIISARESAFTSVKEYIDCSNTELETKLKQSFGDSTLNMISCNRSEFYPEQTAVVHFSVGDLQNGFNTYVIYFIHNRNEDLQISFTYNKETEQRSVAYIDGVMHSLKLL